MKWASFLLTFFLTLCVNFSTFAQENAEAASAMEENGKNLVVIVVVSIVMVGMAIYLFSLGRTVRKLEQKLAE